jgi:ABC-type Fe3+-citrate transport system substrate-binding protein
VSKDQLNKLKQRETAKTNVDDARKVAEVFGKTLDDFIEGSITSEDIELADILAQLEPSERQFLLNAAKAQIAARDSE